MLLLSTKRYKKETEIIKSSYTNRISESDFLHLTVIRFSYTFFVTVWLATYSFFVSVPPL